MFLAIKEIKKYKNKFLLIISIVVLISYLIFFLTGLSLGLANDNISSIKVWNATSIILSEDSNKSIYSSLIKVKELDYKEGKNSSFINVYRGVVLKEELDDKFNVVLIEGNKSQPFFPDIVEGRHPETTEEIIISKRLKIKKNLNIGDELLFQKKNEVLKVVGFTDDLMFSVTETIYKNRDLSEEEMVGAILIHNNQNCILDGYETLAIDDFIDSLPGFKAQVLTFGLMIISLIFITTVVLAVFMYILTIQKKNIFAILKIQGISNKYISNSVLSQTFIINFIGVSIGFVLALVSGIALKNKVPFLINYPLFLGIVILIISFSILGAFFSVKISTQVDPLDALS